MTTRRSTKLRGDLGLLEDQNNDTRTGSNSGLTMGSPSKSSSPEQGCIPSETPQNAQGEPSGCGHTKRGRPKKHMNSSAARGLIRLFVEKPKTAIEQFVKALDQPDEDGKQGHGRLWVRNFLQDVTGAGPKSNLKLKDLRYSEDTTATGPATGADTHGQEGESRLAQDQEIDPENDGNIAYQAESSADESKPRRKARRTQQDIEYGTQEGTSRSEGPDLAPTSIKFADNLPEGSNAKKSNASPHRADDKSGTSRFNRKGKPIRRGTSLSLSKMAIWLDENVGSGHFQIAKKNTISRTPTTGTTEFNEYYRIPTWMSVLSPVACMHPLPGNFLPSYGVNTPPEEALAIRILSLVWVDRLNDKNSPRKRNYDVDARNKLRDAMPQSLANRKAFVNAKDNLGVCPLHLAVAYGFTETCQLLLECGANVEASTVKGTTIYTFADSAAKRTGEEMGLYFRILHCRMFVCAGQLPPAPQSAKDPMGFVNKRKRQRTEEPTPAVQLSSPPAVFQYETDTRVADGAIQQSDSAHVFGSASQRRPSFATEITESPPPSVKDDQHNTFNDPQSDNRISQSRPTTPYLPIPGGYLTMQEDSGNEPREAYPTSSNEETESILNTSWPPNNPPANSSAYHDNMYRVGNDNRLPGSTITRVPPMQQQMPDQWNPYNQTNHFMDPSAIPVTWYASGTPTQPGIGATTTAPTAAERMYQPNQPFLELTGPPNVSHQAFTHVRYPPTSQGAISGYVRETWQPPAQSFAQPISNYATSSTGLPSNMTVGSHGLLSGSTAASRGCSFNSPECGGYVIDTVRSHVPQPTPRNDFLCGGCVDKFVEEELTPVNMSQ